MGHMPNITIPSKKVKIGDVVLQGDIPKGYEIATLSQAIGQLSKNWSFRSKLSPSMTEEDSPVLVLNDSTSVLIRANPVQAKEAKVSVDVGPFNYEDMVRIALVKLKEARRD